MGATSCYYSSSGNGSSSCTSSSLGDLQLSTGAIIGIVIGCIVALLLIALVIILILRVLLRKPLTPYQPPYYVNNQQHGPQTYQMPIPDAPPPYAQTVINNK